MTSQMEIMHQLTSTALSFVQEVQDYAKAKGFILLQEEPIIHLQTEERLRLTITQSLYVGENDIEITIVGYLEEGHHDTIVEATFDLLLPDASRLNHLHETLSGFRNHQTTHFFICIKGSNDDGFYNDELSVVVRSRHQIGSEQTMNQWDQLLNQFREAQTVNPSPTISNSVI